MTNRHQTKTNIPTRYFWVGLCGLGTICAVVFLTCGSVSSFTGSAIAGDIVEAGPPPVRTKQVGDAFLNGEIALDSAVERDGEYTVRLFDGARAQLTLRPALQEKTVRILKGARAPEAVVVVLKPNGDILSLAGLKDSKQMQPRLALAPWAPAASIFKLVTTAALVKEGVSADRQTCYRGGFHGIKTEHLVEPNENRLCDTLKGALAKSINSIYASLSHKHLSRVELADMASRLGFGKGRSFALDWKQGWAEIPDDSLERARTAAGFWHSKLSVLGAATMTAVFANDGLLPTPRLVRSVTYPDGHIQKVIPRQPSRVIGADTAKIVRHMMVATTETGTAKKGFRDPWGRRFFGDNQVAGKTGSLSQNRPYRGYSWFVGFAPADDPAYVVAVLLANPTVWQYKAHSVARMVLEAAFSSQPDEVSPGPNSSPTESP